MKISGLIFMSPDRNSSRKMPRNIIVNINRQFLKAVGAPPQSGELRLTVLCTGNSQHLYSNSLDFQKLVVVPTCAVRAFPQFAISPLPPD